jgi:hypothetical protein
MAISKESGKSMIKTSFVGKNPFKTDLSSIKITNDKPKARTPTNCKYGDLFAQLEVGKSLACDPKDCDKIGQALRDYIRRNKLMWTVKVQSNYNKTSGRVFVLAKVTK